LPQETAPQTIVQKIFESHRGGAAAASNGFGGRFKAGEPFALDVDEVYTQDATGTMAWLQFEAIGIARVKIPCAVSYVDHNMLQSDALNADDHAFLESAAAKFGAWFSRPGNGICHQVNLERFAFPGGVALGTDSHTPTNGGIGMLAIGVGGLDAATVMAGAPFELTVPKVTLVKLIGRLRKPWVTAMDVILELLSRLTVKGGVGRVFEYGGHGVATLSIPERATITNMGAELGATSSIFPSDAVTLKYLNAQGRDKDIMGRQCIMLCADEGAEAGGAYDEVIEIDLGALVPLVAKPHSPDNVATVESLAREGLRVDQICIGGCTNSSLGAMRTVSSILEGRTVARGVSLYVNPGSKQVYEMMADAADGTDAGGRTSSLSKMIAAGARMLESSCGPCIGMGGAPGTGHVSVRTYNRNFKGRSGSREAGVYLASPETCALLAIEGKFVDPLMSEIKVEEAHEPEVFRVNDNMLVEPMQDGNMRFFDVKKGPNIKEVPVKAPLEDTIRATVLIKVGDNITTDDIMPAGAKVLPYRSNIVKMSEFVFSGIDPGFYSRALAAKEKGGGIIIGGENYGQGSSREHAAMAPMYLGVQAVIAKSFARIHRANLINFGILPLVFANPADYEKVGAGESLVIRDVIDRVNNNTGLTVGEWDLEISCVASLNQREREILLVGGLLPYTKNKNG
jgi:aconitate hydratase